MESKRFFFRGSLDYADFFVFFFSIVEDPKVTPFTVRFVSGRVVTMTPWWNLTFSESHEIPPVWWHSDEEQNVEGDGGPAFRVQFSVCVCNSKICAPCVFFLGVNTGNTSEFVLVSWILDGFIHKFNVS